tara:strand:- start:2276 stop:2938 length:663 start_codon:yes stop_codon:yes gene_type:complete
MVDFKFAIKRPFDEPKKLAIGALLFMIPYINILTSLLANGYILVSGKNTINNAKELPLWTDWVDLFIKGVLAMVIWGVFMLPVMIYVNMFNLADPFLNLLNGGNVLYQLSNSGFTLYIGVALALLLAYVAPYAILLYIDRESFKEAFRFSEIFSSCFTKTWFKGWIQAVLYYVVLGFVIAVINSFIAFTVIGPILLIGIYRFVVGITAITLFGQAFKDLK